LESATETGTERYGITGCERVLLYRTAIQTGLRASELRSLTRGRLHCDSTPPYITCKAGSTKNRKDARRYIQPELAADLKAHIATKVPMATLFNLPHESNLARMLRDDLINARKAWLYEVNDEPQLYAQRA
jgi:integrase